MALRKRQRHGNDDAFVKEARKAMGRPTKLNKELLTRIERYLEQGLPVSTVCALTDVRERQWYDWQRAGNEYLKTEDRTGFPPNYELYAYFVIRTKRAVALYEKRKYTESLNTKHYSANWMRDLKLLQIRCRENWAEDSTSGLADDLYDSDEVFL